MSGILIKVWRQERTLQILTRSS